MHTKVGLSPVLLKNLYLILHYYSCTKIILSCYFRKIKVESDDGNYLVSLDALGPGRWLLNMCCQTVIEYSSLPFRNIDNMSLNIYVITEIKHGFSCINVYQFPREMLEYLPRDLADVNARKTCLIPIS